MKDLNTWSRLATELVSWYLKNFRPLPWRQDQDPYRIWISEVMLQQTTVAAVKPYYQRFLERFPNLRQLAESPQEDVLEAWAGLGYYSRARNLHASAKLLGQQKIWPRRYHELLEFKGFGPYTARAVASLAFDEPVGVVDGNVIRLLSRLLGKNLQWWKTKERQQIQEWADQLAKNAPRSSDLNQALMELGATICVTQNPKCILCPWFADCVARKEDRIAEIPLKKPRVAKEVWTYEPQVIEKNKKLLLVKNQDTFAFLKGSWIFPGTASGPTSRPARFDFRHTITHHEIFVKVHSVSPKYPVSGEQIWVKPEDLKKWAPLSLVQKTWAVSVKNRVLEG